MDDYSELASYKKFIDSGRENWSGFLELRQERLVQLHRKGGGAEKITENILEDLFTKVLQWNVADINYQIEYADIVVTEFGIKRLILEAKRPGSLAWNSVAKKKALDQARGYAQEQRVHCIGVSDGNILYIANIKHGILKDRLSVSLDQELFPEDLWWISRQGLHREKEKFTAEASYLAINEVDTVFDDEATSELLHSKYNRPARCFAYVGDANRPRTWRLLYLSIDNSVDKERFPKAIQAILSNYRGSKLSRSSIPEEAIPDILINFAKVAESIGIMPHQNSRTSQCYHLLAEAVEQFNVE